MTGVISRLGAAVVDCYRIERERGAGANGSSSSAAVGDGDMSLRLQTREKLRVRDILRAAGRPLVSDQILSGDHPHRDPVETGGNASLPRRGKLDAVQACQHINTIRCAAQLDDAVVGLE